MPRVPEPQLVVGHSALALAIFKAPLHPIALPLHPAQAPCGCRWLLVGQGILPILSTAETEKTIRQLAAQSGQATDDIVEDAMVAYIKKLGHLRQTLDSRYDQIKNGKVQLIPGDEVEEYFAQKEGNLDSDHSGS